jgi:hypothetical protein
MDRGILEVDLICFMLPIPKRSVMRSSAFIESLTAGFGVLKLLVGIIDPMDGVVCLGMLPGCDCVLMGAAGRAGGSRRLLSTSRGILLSAVEAAVDCGVGELGMFSIASAKDLSMGLILGTLVGVGDP